MEHYDNLGQPPVTTHLHHAKYSSTTGMLSKKTLEEEDTLLEAGTIETSDVESKDTLFWLTSTITCCIAMGPL
jgi:hypothetical protein